MPSSNSCVRASLQPEEATRCGPACVALGLHDLQVPAFLSIFAAIRRDP